MNGDEEMGPVVSTEDVKEEGPCSNGNAAIRGESGTGEFGAGEPGGVGECGEHGKTMLEVC